VASEPVNVETQVEQLPRREAIVWVALGLVGVMLLFRNYGFYGDNLVYASDVTFRPWSLKIHPHHIGYSPLIWLIWSLTKLLQIPWNAFDIMAILSRLAAFGCALQLAFIARHIRLSPGWTALLVLAFVSAFGVWDYGTIAAVYLPTLFALLLIIRQMLTWPTDVPTKQSMFTIGIWFMVAVAFHELAILLLPSFIIWGALCAKWRGERWLYGAYRTTLTLLAPVLYLYVGAFTVSQRSVDPQAFFAWMTKYSEVDRYWWWNRVPEHQSAMSFLSDLMLLAHGKLFWALPVETVYAAATEEPIAMAVQVGWPPERLIAWARTLLGLGGLWVIGSAICAWISQPSIRAALILLLLWLLPIVGFLCFFQPQAPFYRLYEIVPLLLLAVMPFAGEHKPSMWSKAVGLCACLLLLGGGLINYAYGYEPRSRASVNPNFHDLARLDKMPAGPIGFLATRENRTAILHTSYFVDRPVYLIEHYNAENVTSSYGLRGKPDLEQLVDESHAWLATQPNGVWLSATTLRQYRRDKNDPNTPPWRYLRLFDPQPDQDCPAELWIDLHQMKETTLYQGESYEFTSFVAR